MLRMVMCMIMCFVGLVGVGVLHLGACHLVLFRSVSVQSTTTLRRTDVFPDRLFGTVESRQGLSSVPARDDAVWQSSALGAPEGFRALEGYDTGARVFGEQCSARGLKGETTGNV